MKEVLRLPVNGEDPSHCNAIKQMPCIRMTGIFPFAMGPGVDGSSMSFVPQSAGLGSFTYGVGPGASGMRLVHACASTVAEKNSNTIAENLRDAVPNLSLLSRGPS